MIASTPRPTGSTAISACATRASAGAFRIRTACASRSPRTAVHRDVTLTRRAMEALAIDYMVVFPTPMLMLGMHPQPEMEVWLANAYNRWLADKLLAADDRIKSLIYLPFNPPEEARRTGQAFHDVSGVIGDCITSHRYN